MYLIGHSIPAIYAIFLSIHALPPMRHAAPYAPTCSWNSTTSRRPPSPDIRLQLLREEPPLFCPPPAPRLAPPTPLSPPPYPPRPHPLASHPPPQIRLPKVFDLAASRKGLAPLGTTVHSTQSLLPYEIQKQDASTDGPISLLSEDVSRPNSAESPPPLRPTNLPPLVPKDTFSPFKRLHPTMRLPKAAAPIRMPPLPAVPTTDARFDPRGQGSFPRRAHPPARRKPKKKP